MIIQARLLLALLVVAAFASAVPQLAAQESAAASGTSVSMVVTAEARHNMNPPGVDQDDVMVYQGKNRDRVTSWVPASGSHAQLEFYVLMDDSANASLGTQLDDIRQFINSQAATTKVGVAYMQNGIARIVQSLTDDHAQAAKSVRLPLGVPGINASPYFSLDDLVKHWPQSSARREVLMISDGIDRYYEGADLMDPYVSDAIADAQRAGVVVYAIYAPGIGHYGHSYFRTYWGQLYLSQVTDETGGESYYIGFNGPAVAFMPYLNQLDQALKNQYLLTFLANPVKKSGLQQVKVTTELRAVDLVSANRVYVPAQQE